MLLALGCYEAAAGQAELIEPANPWRGDSGQAEATHCRLKHTAGRTWTHSETLKVITLSHLHLAEAFVKSHSQ